MRKKKITKAEFIRRWRLPRSEDFYWLFDGKEFDFGVRVVVSYSDSDTETMIWINCGPDTSTSCVLPPACSPAWERFSRHLDEHLTETKKWHLQKAREAEKMLNRYQPKQRQK